MEPIKNEPNQMTTFQQYQGQYFPYGYNQQPCPTCGHCPTCGRPNNRYVPYFGYQTTTIC